MSHTQERKIRESSVQQDELDQAFEALSKSIEEFEEMLSATININQLGENLANIKSLALTFLVKTIITHGDENSREMLGKLDTALKEAQITL